MSDDDAFTGCPTCKKSDGYLNAGRCHWGFCDTHRLCWPIGSNLFSSWRDETEEQQREAWKHVESFDRVEPDGSPYRPFIVPPGHPAGAFIQDGEVPADFPF